MVDLDDYDAAIHAEWHRDLPPVERARSIARSELSPLRIRARIRQLLPAATMLTVSSWALRRCFPRFGGPEVRLPHPRPVEAYEPPVPSERLRVGFLGTPVGYKGVDTVCRLVTARADAELHVLAGTEDAFSAVGSERLVIHEHHGPETLAAAFATSTWLCCRRIPSTAAARLPAAGQSFVDALRFGRPVVATDTPPIRELARPSVALISSWSRLTTASARSTL